jgi:hypothetical protein
MSYAIHILRGRTGRGNGAGVGGVQPPCSKSGSPPPFLGEIVFYKCNKNRFLPHTPRPPLLKCFWLPPPLKPTLCTCMSFGWNPWTCLSNCNKWFEMDLRFVGITTYQQTIKPNIGPQTTIKHFLRFITNKTANYFFGISNTNLQNTRFVIVNYY